MNANDNAFPTTGNGPTDGLTKREWLAGLAMQAILSIPDDRTLSNENPEAVWEWKRKLARTDARLAVLNADALIAALNEGEKK